MRDFKSFLKHEQQVVQNTIDRQTKSLEWYKPDDHPLEGQRKMIDIQKRHVAMLDTLLAGDVQPKTTLSACEEALRMAELKHRAVIQTDKTHDEMWWETLDVIQFLSNLIFRIENWQQGT